MLLKILQKAKTSVCKMAQIAGVDLFPIDIGMVSDVPGVTKKEYKIAPGTKNMTWEAAMTRTKQSGQSLRELRLWNVG